MSRAIYKLNIDCHRQGSLEGVFIAEKEQIEYLVNNKIEIYFGEVLGKHSQVIVTIDENEIIEVTDNEEFIKLFEQHDLSSGFSPFGYHTSMNDADLFEDQWQIYLDSKK